MLTTAGGNFTVQRGVTPLPFLGVFFFFFLVADALLKGMLHNSRSSRTSPESSVKHRKWFGSEGGAQKPNDSLVKLLDDGHKVPERR